MVRSNLKRIHLLFIAFLCSFVGILQVYSDDRVAIPALTGRVVDLAQLLSPEASNDLNQKLQALEKEKGSQFVILTLLTTKPEEIEQFGIRLAESWKIGRAKVDDGVILIVAKDDKRVRIEVGYGLEGVLTDVYTKRIIEGFIVPEFKNGNFSKGIVDGSNAIISAINNEILPLPYSNPEENGVYFIIFIIVALVILEFFFPGIIWVIGEAALNSSSGSSSRGGGSFRSGGGSFGGGGSSGSW